LYYTKTFTVVSIQTPMLLAGAVFVRYSVKLSLIYKRLIRFERVGIQVNENTNVF